MYDWWLSLPLWKIMEWKSVGMRTFPQMNGKSLKIPWFQSPPTSPYFMVFDGLPSVKLLHNYGKSPCLMGKSSNCMIFAWFSIKKKGHMFFGDSPMRNLWSAAFCRANERPSITVSQWLCWVKIMHAGSKKRKYPCRCNRNSVIFHKILTDLNGLWDSDWIHLMAYFFPHLIPVGHGQSP